MWRAQRHGISVGSGVRPGGVANSRAANSRAANSRAGRGGRARRRGTLGCAALLVLAVTAAGCGANKQSKAGTTPINGGTATYALPAGINPNYIFPFAPGTVFTIVNLDNLSYYLYRPLYWWGDQGKPYLDEKLSLAYEPQYPKDPGRAGQVVTIKLKPGLRWSNGTFVTAKNIMFWMNMMKVEAPLFNWGGYVPGGLPDNVRDVHAVGQYEVQMTITTKYSPLWFTDNELSQITPMPEEWDRTGPNTRSDCTDNYRDCAAVFDYLYGQSKNTAKWVTSPLWSVVDGPWQLTGYNQGVLTFTFNRNYSLWVPPHHITTLREIPFTSEEAEFNQLQAGGSNPIDVGYLPTVDAPVPPPGTQVGQNPVSGYRLQPVYTWGLSYIPYNFNPADSQAPIFDQQYFREAFQLLVNQAAIIQGALHGYGVVTTGPVGDTPPTKYLSPMARAGDPDPVNLGKARTILSKHGWRVDAAGVTRCIDPGKGSDQCGPGIKPGAKLVFKMLYATGAAWVEATALQLQSNAAQVGIQLKLTGEPFDTIIGTVSNGCGPKPTIPKPCPWQLADWGQGWSYVPDYLPTGDELFQTGSIGNTGQYSNSHDDKLIRTTLQTSNTKAFLTAMYAWEQWLTPQLPVIYQPSAPAYLIESIDSLHIGKQSPTLALTPEDWYFTK